jgi:hypothetical protein
MRYVGGKKERHREGMKKNIKIKECTSIGRKVDIEEEQTRKLI